MGIDKIHSNSIVPIRASKKHKLSEEEKWYNNEISKIRIAIEHVNAFIKKFKITSTRYRNRRKDFKLYMALICGIYNFETANL
jgi:transposase